MQRPFDTVLETANRRLEKYRIDLAFNFNQNDKILVWIVGFSIAIISLIVSNVSAIDEIFTECILKTILILLSISVICGIIYRFSALFSLIRFQNIMFYLEESFLKEKTMPTKTLKLEDPNDIYEIYQNIKDDFDEDYLNVVKRYNQEKTEGKKKEYVDYLTSEYEQLAKWAANEYQRAERYVKRTCKTAFGLSDKKIDKIFSEDKNAFYLKLYKRICILSILICIVCFISALVLLVLNYFPGGKEVAI